MLVHFDPKNRQSLDIEGKQCIFGADSYSIDVGDGISPLQQHNTEHVLFESDDDLARVKVDEVCHRVAISKHIRILNLQNGDWAVAVLELDCLVRFVLYCAFELTNKVDIAFDGPFVAG